MYVYYYSLSISMLHNIILFDRDSHEDEPSRQALAIASHQSGRQGNEGREPTQENNCMEDDSKKDDYLVTMDTYPISEGYKINRKIYSQLNEKLRYKGVDGRT